MSRFIAILIGLFLFLGLAGCKLPEMNKEDAGFYIQQAREIAKENGTSWKIVAVAGGEPNVYAKTSFGFDTDLRFEMHFQGNAQTAAAESDDIE